MQACYPWPGTLEAARALQLQLAAEVSSCNAAPETPRLVVGVDVSPPDAEGWVTGAVVTVRWPALTLAEARVGRVRPTVPYVPGYLAFREAPAVTAAMEQLCLYPDVVLVDGQGQAHPRRFGLACHLGLTTGIPTVGCAKSRLVGAYDEPGHARGSWTPLRHRGEEVGAAVRTRDGVSPLFVSVGHRVSMAAAIALTLGCCGRYRTPEPTRLAHQAAAGRIAQGLYDEHGALMGTDAARA